MSPSLRDLLKSAGASYSVAEFPRGAVLFRQGDPCHDGWSIESGRVRLTVTSWSGQEAVSGLLGAGALVCDCLLPGQRELPRSAVAVERTVALRIPRSQLAALLHTDTGVLDHVLQHLIAQHLDMENALVHQILDSGEERLAHTLLSMAECRSADGRCLLPNLSQEIIAEMVGTTRSRVSFFMSRFRKAGFIETSGREMYVHPARLSRAVRTGWSARLDNRAS